ncbi:MAG: hypothetical protein DI604_17405, partial [Delftia acidovorans]
RAVQQWGGVLEHPAKSRAWELHGLTKPTRIGWRWTRKHASPPCRARRNNPGPARAWPHERGGNR